jgi:ABC-type Mn2+/Zn2+ transport system permease subunit
MALAAAIGGLIGAQIVERSMAIEAAAISQTSVDAGAVIASAGGAMAGGTVLAMLMGCLEQYFARKQRGPRAM